MPSQLPIPTVEQLRSAFIDAVVVGRNRADKHTGSSYDYLNGTGAILWSKEIQHVRDLFRAIYIDDADGPDLTDRIQKLWQVTRILDAYGTGYATFQRPTDAAGSETFHEGTRLQVGATSYAISAEQLPTEASALYAVVPIRSTTFGPGSAIASPSASITDELDDPSWFCTGLTCSDGTLFEKAALYRARARAQRVNSRVGYADGPDSAIFQACSNAGAAYIAAYPSTAFGTGFGANPGYPQPYSAVYTGDANYTGTRALSNACGIACESARSLGAETYFGPMAPTSLAIAATVYLWDNPAVFDQNQLTNLLRGALLASFYSSVTGGFSFTRDSLAGAMMGVSSAIQSIAFVSPSSDLGILTGSPPGFPASLPRYQVFPQAINFTYAPPQ